jgi:dethiobiotin synthetase
MNHSVVFITATDTESGKTTIGAAICMLFRRLGCSIGVMKPAETGCTWYNGTLIPQDATILMRYSGFKEDLDLVCPYKFLLPVAPSSAAEMEGIEIYPERIMDCFRLISSKVDFTLIEGAGGILTPLSKHYLMIDLIAEMESPVVVVSRNELGCINQTLLTLRELRRTGVKIAAVFLNDSKCESVPQQKNSEQIRKFGGIEQLIEVPYYESLHPDGIRKISSLLENIDFFKLLS